MTFPLKRSVLFSLSLTLSACSGGSFETKDVKVDNDPKPAPKVWKDETSQPRQTPKQVEGIMQPALGYEMAIPRRNVSPFDKDGNRIPDGKHAEEEVALSADNVKAIAGDPKQIPHQDEMPSDYYASLKDKANNFEFVHAGYVYDPASRLIERNNGKITTFRQGANGYVYYQGVNPATELPVGKTATYQGTWAYVTDAKRGREGRELGFDDSRATDRYGAVSSMADVESQQSEFQADFANKKLTGTLKETLRVTEVQKNKEKVRYTLEADIVGNRFRGSAKAAQPDDSIFGSSSSLLEGGFYGVQAQELGGKFLANDNSLFAVFSGKQSNVVPTETVFDAKIINQQSPKSTPQNLTTFGDVTTLLVDNQKIPLYPNEKGFVMKTTSGQIQANICCHNLDNVRFGTLYQNRNMQYFLQGERTPTANIPQAGQAYYQGTWDAYISGKSEWSTSASNAETGSKAQFNVDFANKTIEGKLIGEDRLFPTFTINGKLEKNGFVGEAKTGTKGFSLDPQNTHDTQIVHIKSEVKGGFYGDKAQELGGAFSGIHSGYENINKEINFGVVFGAKRQVKNQ
ncbi:transferrin-binding protein-like solute binding protein [Actinobacillus capsulatus]|uniref:transferrin-binding protein-like solute binding protein n=1 Tax=Actinobacillus capsulatus TaxID=717 RepID=UPI00036D7466|nr:transferrin-binding protein-like solute binding protein [Actinobacillus capsulatus]